MAVDISTHHLSEAVANFKRFKITNIQTERVVQIVDIENLNKVNLVYSVLVLQHNPPPVMREILRKLCTRVKLNGFIYMQIPTYRNGYSYSVADDLTTSSRTMEMHVLPQAVVFEILQKSGLEVTESAAIGDLAFRSQVILAQKSSGWIPG